MSTYVVSQNMSEFICNCTELWAVTHLFYFIGTQMLAGQAGCGSIYSPSGKLF